MPILIGFLVLVLTLYALQAYTRASPAALALLVKRVGGLGSFGAGAFLLLRGRIDLGLMLGAFGLWLLGFFSLPMKGFRGMGGGAPAGGVSHVRSAMIEMELDHASGAIRGTVLAGRNEGKALDALTRTDLMDVYRSCRRNDPDGARLLEVYLDRRFSGWRQAGNGQGNAGSAGSGGAGPARRAGSISEDEAYEILGLKKGAARQDIARAHRDLMKKLHPDHGGTTDLAARVNEAKDVLLRRHH
ncbi:MAG: DnaJ domain-containing protein [Methylocystis sp.]|nr:DnaJ domain-containing protein [Methylocystis sp.]MBI3274689.1 DnaJ domain-containing protein [Methylocystis sp.]